MRLNRVFVNCPLVMEQGIILPDEPAHHVSRVLRMREGQQLQIFNGTGGCYLAQITSINKNSVQVLPTAFLQQERETELQITLAQGISRGRHMDYTVQKAVELGVTRIVPLVTEYSNVRLDEDRSRKRLLHWQKIIINACEQCGRNRLPEILEPSGYSDWILRESHVLKLVLSPQANECLSDFSPQGSDLLILSGPEGGLSEAEIIEATRNDYMAVQLGPRILRTETAAIAVISACQTLWGDMA